MKRSRLASFVLAFGLVAASQGAAHAFTTPFVLLDMMVKQSNKEALAIPEHGKWCAEHHPGYRVQWNNWRTADGRVAYCASPYYTSPWQVPYAKR